MGESPKTNAGRIQPPPGPRPLISWLLLFSIRRDPLAWLERVAGYGPVASFRVGPQPVYLFNDPDAIRDLLLTHDEKMVKGRGLQIARRLLGDGLLTSEGELHRRQRALMQPVFHRQKVAGFGPLMCRLSLEHQQRWRDGQEIEASADMAVLTLAVAAQALFESQVEDPHAIGRALTQARDLFMFASFPGSEWLERLIPPVGWRFQRIKSQLDRAVMAIIAEHRANPQAHNDLLSRLLQAGDMPDAQVRDEVMTLFLAGHETTAAMLGWTLHLLSTHPEWQERVAEECRGWPGLPQDVGLLTLLQQVLYESLRMYPPAWVMGRRSLEEVRIAGYPVPAGSLLLASQWITHRDARFYPRPEQFDPGRWTPEARASRPRHAYFPFGAGSRVCIGEHFAMLEAALVLAVLLPRWRFEPVPGARVSCDASITLRPRGVRLRLRRRD